MAESIQRELDEYRASEEEVKRLKNVMVSHSGSTGRSVKSLKVVSWRTTVYSELCFHNVQGIDESNEGEMGEFLSDNTAKLTSAMRYCKSLKTRGWGYSPVFAIRDPCLKQGIQFTCLCLEQGTYSLDFQASPLE